MPDLTSNDLVAAMLADPLVSLTRYDSDYQVGPNFNTNCRPHYTPASPPTNPAPSPIPPIAPIPLGPKRVGRPTNARRQAEAAFQIATEAFTKASAAYPAELAAYTAQLTAYQAYIAKAEAGEEVDTLPDPDSIFTHGKGSRLDAPAIVAFSEGFARTQCMLSFHDSHTYNERASTFGSLLNNFPSATAIGGRSMDAQACARAQLYGPAKKVIFFSYPLVSSLKIKTEELVAIEPDVNVLFIIGDEDPKAMELHFREVRARMRCRTWWMKVIRGDHSLFFSAKFLTKREKICNVIGRVAARWNEDHDPALTEMVVDWE